MARRTRITSTEEEKTHNEFPARVHEHEKYSGQAGASNPVFVDVRQVSRVHHGASQLFFVTHGDSRFAPPCEGLCCRMRRVAWRHVGWYGGSAWSRQGLFPVRPFRRAPSCYGPRRGLREDLAILKAKPTMTIAGRRLNSLNGRYAYPGRPITNW